MTHNNQTWDDVCFRVPIISTPPQCLNKYLSFIKLLGRRRRKREISDDWFEDDSDFGIFETDEDHEDEECKDFKIPSFSPSQLAAMTDLSKKIEKEGLSLEVGKF